MKWTHFLKKYLPKQPALLGLTLTQQYLRLTELSFVDRDYRLRSCHQIPLPSPQESNHFSFSNSEFPAFLKQSIQQLHITTDQVALALPYQSVLFKSIELDKNLTQTEIAIRVREHAEQYFNYPLSELMMDFEWLGPSKNHEDLMQIRWVAARRQEVDMQINALNKAGLRTVAVEVDSFSLQRAVDYCLRKRVKDTVAVIHLHETQLLLIVFHKRHCRYTRAENYAFDTSASMTHDVSSAVIDILQAFLYANPDNTLSLILLTGEFVSDALLEKTHASFNVATERLDVFSHLNCLDKKIAHQCAVSVGLAMRILS